MHFVARDVISAVWLVETCRIEVAITAIDLAVSCGERPRVSPSVLALPCAAASALVIPPASVRPLSGRLALARSSAKERWPAQAIATP